jgi:hypothetical protein
MKLDDNFVFAHRYYMVVKYNTSGVKERKSPARGDFTPSKTSPGRRRFEAQREFRPLRRAA